MILNKRIKRDFIDNIGKYIGMIVLVMISSMLIVGFANSTDCVLETGKKAAIENNLEDGEFFVDNELSSITLKKISNMGITIEENFYVDYKIYENVTVRIFKERKNINKISLNEGNDLSKSRTIIIDQHFGKANNYKIGDALKIDNKDFKICGYGISPEYTEIIQNSGDVVPNAKEFGIGYISESDFKNIKNKSYSYVFKLNGASADALKVLVSKNAKLTEFLKTEDNIRAIGYIDYSQVNKKVAIIIGVVLCIMVGFMISMSLINSIDLESPIIGALYSLGYVKKEIVSHFMILPTIIVTIGAIAGTILGFIIEASLAETTTDIYALPNVIRVYPPYLIFVGVVVPILIVVTINYFIISKKLNMTPLQLLRREKKTGSLNTIKINHFNFVTKFRLREFLREFKSNIVLFFGIFISTFLLVFGVSINSAINKYVQDVKNESTYNYMYALKLPIEAVEDKDTEKITLKKLSIYSKDIDMDMEIMLQGIKKDTNFYSFSINDDDDGLYISNCVKDKFHLNIGETIYLKDKSDNKIYNLKIKGSVDYKSGLYVFMNQKKLNSLLGEDKTYFNGYLSKEKLNINEDYIYSTTTSESIYKSAQNATGMMRPIIMVLIVFSIILFVISMYLLLKLMIDKSITSIALIKIFGFTKREINKLYLGSSLYTVMVSALISVPLTIKITKSIYPNLISNVQTYFSITLQKQHYLFIIFIIMASYFISNTMLKNHINKISLIEALKNRD